MRDDGFIDYLHELLEPLGRIGVRRMFGGHGLYCDGRFFAIVIESRLYLKVDAQSRAAFAAAGCSPFVYQGRGRPIEMSYWNAPEAAMDSADDMRPWARMALDAAQRAADAKPPKRPAAKATKLRRAPPTTMAGRQAAASATKSRSAPRH
jgi:DNA transformation protein